MLSSFLSIRLVRVHVVHPYSSIDTIAAWKKLPFISSVRSDFYMTDSLSIPLDAFASVSMSVSKSKRQRDFIAERSWFIIIIKFPMYRSGNSKIYHHYHHHQEVSTAWISLTLSRHLSLSVIALVKSSKRPQRNDACKFLPIGQQWCVHV